MPHLNNAAGLKQRMTLASRLLIIRLRSLGDSILMLPLIEALHAWRPELQLDVVTESPFAPVFSGHPAIHDTLVLRHRAQGGPGWSRGRSLVEIRRRRYPIVVNLHGGTTSALLTLASGATDRLGQEGYRNRWAYTAMIPSSSRVWQRYDLHTVEHQLSLMRWLQLPVPATPRGRLPLDPNARAQVRQRIVSQGIEEYILIHPTATLFTKQWKEANYAELADLLFRSCSLPVVFTAGATESQVLFDIRKQARIAHSYWSDLTLQELFGAIQGCRLFVGNDSGPTHVAASLGKPVVVVWGSSNYRAWRPWGTRYELIKSDLDCIPCPGYSCAVYGSPRCILDITVQRVFEACRKMLES
jgi:lipopolysaccharide heptosyltransferase II